MLALARRVLASGRAVVLDAVFLKPEERRAAAGVARDLGVPFRGVWLEGRPETLRSRLQARRGDASDAGPTVLDQQLAQGAGEVDWTRIDAADPGAAAARIVDGTGWN
jgi:hypothetical protein